MLCALALLHTLTLLHTLVPPQTFTPLHTLAMLHALALPHTLVRCTPCPAEKRAEVFKATAPPRFKKRLSCFFAAGRPADPAYDGQRTYKHLND